MVDDDNMEEDNDDEAPHEGLEAIRKHEDCLDTECTE